MSNQEPSRPKAVPSGVPEIDADAPSVELTESLYVQLKDIAARQMRGERRGHLLQPTAVVHEAWLRMRGPERVAWKGRSRFLAVGAGVMRRVLVDHARYRDAVKRGGGKENEQLSSSILVSRTAALEALELEDALAKLAKHSERQAKLVELRLFGGLSTNEAAELLGVSRDIAKRELRIARAWLNRALDSAGDEQ